VTEALNVADLTAKPRAAAMPQFRYRTDTPAGRIIVDELDALSRDEVVRRIESLEDLTIEAEIAKIRCYGRL
jgi:hypothetical protein